MELCVRPRFDRHSNIGLVRLGIIIIFLLVADRYHLDCLPAPSHIRIPSHKDTAKSVPDDVGASQFELDATYGGLRTTRRQHEAGVRWLPCRT